MLTNCNAKVPSHVLLSLCAILPLVVALRITTLFYPSQKWGVDEGLFLVMARDLLHGNLPYTLTFDNKPPGLYLIYALALLAFGGSARAVYLAACFSIWFGAVGMFFLVRRATASRNDMAIVAAFAFALFFCQYRALGAKEQLFFVPLDLAALALVWPSGRETRRPLPLLSAGLIMGFALCVKPLALADLIVALIAIRMSEARQWGRKLGTFLIAVPIAPVLLTLPYVLTGQARLLYDTQIRANLARLALHEPVQTTLVLVLRQFVTMFPLLELLMFAPLYLLRAPASDTIFKQSVRLALVWVGIDLFFIFRVGLVRDTLLQQIEAPLVVIGTIVLCRGIELLTNKWPSIIANGVGALAIIAVTAILIVRPLRTTLTTVHAYALHGPSSIDDQASVVAQYLQRKPGSDAFLITAYSDMEYFLAGRQPLTRYGYIYYLADKDFVTISGADPTRELKEIFEHPPSLILLDTALKFDRPQPVFFRIVNQSLRRAYSGPKRIGGSVLVFRMIRRM